MKKNVQLNRKDVKKIIDFLFLNKKNWVPGRTSSSLCSLHFKEEDFIRHFNAAGAHLKSERRKEDIGVRVFPKEHANWEGEHHEPPLKTGREKRMASHSG